MDKMYNLRNNTDNPEEKKVVPKKKSSTKTKKPSKKHLAEQNASEALNLDCLIEIFKHLKIVDRIRLERVCRLWRTASQASWHNFTSLDFSVNSWGELPDDRIDNDAFKSFMKRCAKHITHIVNPHASFKYKIDSPKPLFSCINLTSVDLTVMKVGVRELKLLAKSCDRITELKLGHSTSAVHDDFMMKVVFAKCTKLRVFQIKDSYIDGSCLKGLSSDHLEVLLLENCYDLEEPILSENLRKLENLRTLSLRASLVDLDFDFHCLSNLKKLESLNVAENFDEVHNESLKIIANNCFTLTTLILDGNDLIGDDGLSDITSLPNLKHLSISQTKVTIARLSSMPNLQVFECVNTKIKDPALIRLLKTSRNIEVIDLTRCRKISSKVLEAAVKLLESRDSGKKLKLLLRGTKIDFAPKNVELLDVVLD